MKQIKEQLSSETKLLQEKTTQLRAVEENLNTATFEKDKLSKEMSNQNIRFNHDLLLEKEKQVQKDTIYMKTIREKDEKINSLESEVLKLTQEINDNYKDHSNKVSELNKEITKLTLSSERLKSHSDVNASYSNQGKISNQVFTTFKHIKEVFSEFKETLDKLNKEKDSHFKFKILENMIKENDANYSKWKDEMKEMKLEFSLSLEKSYEMKISKYRDELNETSFKLTKLEYSLTEEKEKYDLLLKQNDILVNENSLIRNLVSEKEILIEKLRETHNELSVSNSKLEKNIEDLEMNLNKIKTDFNMNKDEIENVCFLIDDILVSIFLY